MNNQKEKKKGEKEQRDMAVNEMKETRCTIKTATQN
jgi:hypothetical protein